MIANVQVSNAWSNFLDDAGTLVPAYQRDCERKVTLANVMVGVAQPSRRVGDQHFALFGAVQLDLFDAPLFMDVP